MKTVAKLWIDNGPSFHAGADNIYCINNFQAIFFFAARHLYPKIFERKGKEESRQNWRMMGGSSGAVPNSQPSHTIQRCLWWILGVEIFLGERVGGMDSPLNYLLVLVGALDRGFLIW